MEMTHGKSRAGSDSVAAGEPGCGVAILIGPVSRLGGRKGDAGVSGAIGQQISDMVTFLHARIGRRWPATTC